MECQFIKDAFEAELIHFAMVRTIDTSDPNVRRIIIDQYHKFGEKFVTNEYKVSRQDVANWKTLLATTGSLKPRFSQRGRDTELSAREIRKIENELLNNPYLTNAELAAKVKNKVTPRTIGNYISRSSLGFKTKLETADVEGSFSQQTYDEGLKFIKRIKRIPLSKRIYVDETSISSGVRRRTGRFATGRSTAVRRNRKYPRHTVISAIHKKKWLHRSIIYKSGSIKTEDFEKYVRFTLAPKLKEGDVVIWDRLGRSGRSTNPTALHFSPKAKKYIINRGADLIILPSYGKYFDPIEVVFGSTKRIFEKDLGRVVEPSKVTFEEKQKMWHKAEKQVTLKMFEHAYHMRANGQEFLNEYARRGFSVTK